MNFNSTRLAATILGLSLALSSSLLQAQANLVANPGFESNGGSYDLWTLTAATDGYGFADVDLGGLTAHEGGHYFGFAATGNQPDVLSQVVPVVASVTYDIQFSLNTAGVAGTISAAFNGQTLLNLSNVNLTSATDANGWANFDYKVTTPSSLSGGAQLTFSGLSKTGVVGLDSVSVSVVPEPANLSVVAASLLLGGVLAGRRSGWFR